MKSLREVQGRLAVVTGASGGIGFCFCRRLASAGCSLLMVSNEDVPLEQCARKLRTEYPGISIHYVCIDLTAADGTDRLLRYLDSHDLEADYLINNAGVFAFEPVAEMTDERINRFIDLHIRAVTNLTREFARRFVSRGHGRILNMSSMSCWMPMPGIAMYAATKAYIRVLSRSMHYELCDSGVTVTAACPGGIATDLFGLPERLKQLAVKLGVLATPERFADKALRQMLSGRRQYINGMLNRLSIVGVALSPTWIRMMIKHRMLDKNIRV